MAPELVGFLFVILLVALIALRMWVGVAMGIVGVIGLSILRNMDMALASVAEIPFGFIVGDDQAAVLMFALMGSVIAESLAGKGLPGVRSVILPVMPLMLYGMISGQPVGNLLVAGIVPGILFPFAFLLVNIVVKKLRFVAMASAEKLTVIDKIRVQWRLIPFVILFFLVVAGIYSGVLTAIESGAIGAAGAIVISLVFKSLDGKRFIASIKETAITVGMVFSLVFGASLFIRFISLSEFPFVISLMAVARDFPLVVFMIPVATACLVMSKFLPAAAIVVISVPIVYPALMAAGFDPVWLGVFMVCVSYIGLFAPPEEMQAAGLDAAPGKPGFYGRLPFVSANLLVIIAICVFPMLVTWLPSRMG